MNAAADKPAKPAPIMTTDLLNGQYVFVTAFLRNGSGF
jgi:hypothetical protein